MLTSSFVSSCKRAPLMAAQEVVTTAELAKQILACSEEQFTGQLDLTIKEPKGQRWSLYFCQGRLIWGASDLHPIRRLLRQLSVHCPQLAIDRNTLANLCMESRIHNRAPTDDHKEAQPQG